MEVALELLLILVLVVLNGLLAMSEIAVVTARKLRLRRRADQGDAGAEAALELAAHPSRLLSTVQIGITLMGLLAGVVGGATLADRLANRTGLPEPWDELVAVVLVVVPLTWITVLLGELVPKRIALADPEGVAIRVAGPMRRLAALGKPLVWLLSRSTDLVVRLLRIRDRRDTDITEEDLVAALHQAARRGVIEPQEQRIVERLFRLSDLTVAGIMTPGEEIVSIALGAELDLAVFEAAPHPWYIVTGPDGQPVGFVDVHALWLRALRGRRTLASDAVRDPHRVSADMPALRLLHLFQASGVHLALVRDASERVIGLVTLTDLLERVVGELPDAAELDDQPIIRRADGSWLVDGSVKVRELAAVLAEEHGRRLAEVHEPTVAQLILARAPTPIGPTTAVVVDGVRLEVVDLDWDRIDKVLVVVPPAAPA